MSCNMMQAERKKESKTVSLAMISSGTWGYKLIYICWPSLRFLQILFRQELSLLRWNSGFFSHRKKYKNVINVQVNR